MTLEQSRKIFEDHCDEIQSKFATGVITFDEAKSDIEKESYEDMARTLEIVGFRKEEAEYTAYEEYRSHHI